MRFRGLGFQEDDLRVHNWTTRWGKRFLLIFTKKPFTFFKFYGPYPGQVAMIRQWFLGGFRVSPCY